MSRNKSCNLKLNDWLKKFKTKDGEVSTHLRIPNNELGIFGGKYCITNKEDLLLFNKLYNKKVFDLGLPEYLTETQDRENGGPIFLDLDFKYNDIQERQHDSDIINDIIECYLQHLSSLIDTTNGFEKFTIWVFEKDEINKLKNKKMLNETVEYDVKDGIHMIFELIMPHDMQLLLRELVSTTIEEEVFDALRPALVNDVDDIIDKSISSGSTGIQMYGSKKPGGKPYKLTGSYKVIFNNDVSEFQIQCNADNQMLEAVKENKHLPLYFSTRTKFKNYKKVKINPALKKKYLENKEKQSQRNLLNSQMNSSCNNVNQPFVLLMNQKHFETIVTKEELQKYVKIFVLDSENQEYITAHKYLMVLGSDYYRPYNYWFKAGQALYSKGNELVLSWALWSSQSEDWDWSNGMEMIMKYWKDIDNLKEKLISVGTLRYWAQKDNQVIYNKIHKEALSYYMKETLFGEGTEYDLARLCYFMYSDKYSCVNLKGQGEWWEFNSLLKDEYKHCWTECETGTSLRRKLSASLSNKYIEEERKTTEKMKHNIRLKQSLEKKKDDPQAEAAIQKVDKILAQITKTGAIFNNIAIKLKKTTHKQKIMTECKDLFRDPFLQEKLDSNPYTLCFNNGIYDFKDSKMNDNNNVKYYGAFRPGYPEDYISKSTRLDYIKFNKNNEKHVEIKKEIDYFMETIFVDESLRKYMWAHLASALIGVNKAQTFNIYYGGGSNGKSMLVKFMKVCLGDYAKIDVPLTLITQKRVGVGDTSPEIADLKGVRFAVMQEASKGDTINDGIMKQLTGGDVLTGRHLFKDPISFIPQFTLCLCLNVMPTINSNDGGTWRRIRKCDFESTFVDTRKHNISLAEADKQFPMDRDLEENFTRWAPIMISLLIDIAQETMGDVEDCDKVLEASNRYREREDYLTQFFSDKIIITNNQEHLITKMGVKGEFRAWWQIEKSGQVPKMSELTDFLDKKYDPLARTIPEYRGWRMKNDLIDDESDADV